jgi:uncharacterized protein (TIGR03435 family)
MLPPGGTHYVITCIPLKTYIAQAWNLDSDNIQGGPARVLAKPYDLSATTPDGQPWTYDSLRPMLQQMLIDRFHLAVHEGTKQVSGYALVVAKGGSKLKPTEVEASKLGQKAGVPMENSLLPGYVRGRGLNMSGIAGMLSIPTHSTVVDQTGFTGTFNFDLHFSKPEDTDSNYPPFNTAVEEQLGLKLEPQKVTVRTLIIDHIDSEPTAN